jgi:hypothetical protein
MYCPRQWAPTSDVTNEIGSLLDDFPIVPLAAEVVQWFCNIFTGHSGYLRVTAWKAGLLLQTDTVAAGWHIR